MLAWTYSSYVHRTLCYGVGISTSPRTRSPPEGHWKPDPSRARTDTPPDRFPAGASPRPDGRPISLSTSK